MAYTDMHVHGGWRGCGREAGTAGFYSRAKGSVVVCDFQSLYPSVIIANNLCYTTLGADGCRRVPAGNLDEWVQAPGGAATAGFAAGESGSWFCKAHVEPGLLPIILQELLAKVFKYIHCDEHPVTLCCNARE